MNTIERFKGGAYLGGKMTKSYFSFKSALGAYYAEYGTSKSNNKITISRTITPKIASDCRTLFVLFSHDLKLIGL